jgi:hypothetical protein
MQTDLDPDSFGLITSPSMQNILDTEFWTKGGVDSFWEKIANRYADRMFVGNEINASSPGGAHAMAFVISRRAANLRREVCHREE